MVNQGWGGEGKSQAEMFQCWSKVAGGQPGKLQSPGGCPVSSDEMLR